MSAAQDNNMESTMDSATLRRLCEITKRFYREHAASFSSTRQGFQQGWYRCAKLIVDALACDAKGVRKDAPTYSFLDMACGNLRLERFLFDEYPQINWHFYALDSCGELAGDFALIPTVASGAASSSTASSGAASSGATSSGTASSSAASIKKCEPSPISFRNFDIIEALIDGTIQQCIADIPLCDGAVCFGFFHHVPTMHLRIDLLRTLTSAVRPGGYIVVSFWRFMSSPELARRAQISDAHARDALKLPALEAGDYLLGWQNTPGVWRYCHHFEDDEIDALVAAVPEAEIVVRFYADGRTGALNNYLVLRRTQ